MSLFRDNVILNSLPRPRDFQQMRQELRAMPLWEWSIVAVILGGAVFCAYQFHQSVHPTWPGNTISTPDSGKNKPAVNTMVRAVKPESIR
jgi:hypothetical protein